MAEKLLIAPFTKVDKESRVVSGYATLEVPDKTTPIPEVVDYDSAKAAFASWIGNIREMHLPIAVGKAIEVVPDDEKRGIYLSAKISKSRDGEDAWTKIQEGVLTAFSIGMKGLKRTPEMFALGDKKTPVNRVRFDSLAETSLVDNPGCPGTFFDAVKAVLPEAEKKDVDPNVGGGVDRDKLPASDFVDPERRRFPIVTAGDVSDAVSSYGRAKPKIPFATFKRRLTAIAKCKGFESALPAEWKDEGKAILRDAAKALLLTEAVKCEACDIHAALDALHAITALIDNETFSQAMGEDEADDIELLVEAFERVHEFIAKELVELLADREAPEAAGAAQAARPDPDGIKALLAEHGESVKAMVAGAIKDLAGKADLAPLSEGVQKATAATEAVKTDLAAIAKRVETLETSPAPGGPVLRPEDLAKRGIATVEKGGGGQAGEGAKAVLADIAKSIEEERDPRKKEGLGQVYVTLSAKYGV